MNYNPDPGKDDSSRKTRNLVDKESAIDLFDKFIEEGSISSAKIEDKNVGMGTVKGFPPATYEPGLEEEVGFFTTLLFNQADEDEWLYNFDQAVLKQVGNILAPEKTVFITEKAEDVAGFANGRVINKATVKGGHASLGYGSDGQIVNEERVQGNFGEGGYGVQINDGVVTASMSRTFGPKSTHHGTGINRGTVKVFGDGGTGLYINTGDVERISGPNGLDEAVYINFGTIENQYEHLQGIENPKGTIIDPSLEEEEYSDIAEYTIGKETLAEHSDLEAYVNVWQKIVKNTEAEDLFDILEDLDPRFTTEFRHSYNQIRYLAEHDYEEHKNEDLREHHKNMLRRAQQPHLERYIEAVVADTLEGSMSDNVSEADVEEHKRSLFTCHKEGYDGL